LLHFQREQTKEADRGREGGRARKREGRRKGGREGEKLKIRKRRGEGGREGGGKT